MPSTSGDDPTSLDGGDFLAANRAKREQIRTDEAQKAAKSSAEGGDAAEERPDTTDVGRARPKGLVLALTAAVVVLAVTTAVFAYLAFASGDDPRSDEVDRAGALRDAKSYAAQMLTYEPGKYDELDERIRAISTPEFADSYIKSSQQAREANDAAQASSKGSAENAGIMSIDGETAVVLVALDNTVTSPSAPALGTGNGAYASRVKVTLTRDDGKWLVSDFEVV